MKLLFLVAIFTMTLPLNGQNTTILASASDSIFLPGEVYGLVGRQRSTKFTWVIVEDEDVQYSRGRAVFHGNDNTVSYFRIGGTDTIFALPNMHYGKLGQVITDRRGNKLECIVIEPYDENCACDEGSGGANLPPRLRHKEHTPHLQNVPVYARRRVDECGSKNGSNCLGSYGRYLGFL